MSERPARDPEKWERVFGKDHAQTHLARRCGDRRAVGKTEAAEAGQLQPRMADVEAGDEAKEIELHALDPSGLDAEDAPQ